MAGQGPPKGTTNNKNGRPKGIPNKNASQLRDMVVGAMDKLGGEKWLVEQARIDPKTFINLFAKLLPRVSDVTITEQTPAPSLTEIYQQMNKTDEKEGD